MSRSDPRSRSAAALGKPVSRLHAGAANFGPASEDVRAFIMVASGLTSEQAEAITAAQRASRTTAWWLATATAWKVARKSGLQGLAERAHGTAFAAAAGGPDVKEAAAFAVLPLVLGRRLDDASTTILRAPWEAGVTVSSSAELDAARPNRIDPE